MAEQAVFSSPVQGDTDCDSQLPFQPDLMLLWESVGQECSGNTANPILHRILAFPLSYGESFLLQVGERKIQI